MHARRMLRWRDVHVHAAQDGVRRAVELQPPLLGRGCGAGAVLKKMKKGERLRHLRDALHTGNVDVAQAWAAMEADFDDDEEDVRSPAPIAIAAGPPLL